MYENIGLKHRNKKVQVASNESLWQVMNYINQVSDQLITLGTVFEKLTVAELLSKFHVWRKTLIHSRVPKSSHDIYKLVQNTKTIISCISSLMSILLRAVFTWRIRCGGVTTLSTFSCHCHCVSGQCRRDCQAVKRQRPGSMWCRYCHINRCHSTNSVHSQLSIRWRWFLHTEVPHAFQPSTRRYGVATATATWSRERTARSETLPRAS